jgi:hypothetical protein
MRNQGVALLNHGARDTSLALLALVAGGFDRGAVLHTPPRHHSARPDFEDEADDENEARPLVG